MAPSISPLTEATKAADILKRAAAHIETVGWMQGDLYDSYTNPSKPRNECRVCALGAINVVLHGDPSFPTEGLDAHDLALLVERRLRVDELATWNDELGRTQDDVTTALRETAAQLRGEADR